MRNKLILFLIFLSVLIGITGFWYYQKNIYSKEIIKLEILGPERVEAGEEVEYIVKYKNNGDTRVEEPKLIFEYPEHSITEDGYLRDEVGPEKLGEAIYPGEEKTFQFKARLLGKEKENKQAKAVLTYRPKNLESRYESKTTFTSIIEKVPLTFEFDFPSKIESDKEIKFRLNYFSYIDYPLADLGIKIEYPFNFEFKKSSPSALENTEWSINLLDKSDGGRIEITGKVSGDVGEKKIFEARIGVWQKGEFVLLKEASKGIEIIEPSLYISQQINGNPQYVANAGDLLHYDVFFKNIGEKALTNLSLVTKLEGKIFDLETIKTFDGNFGPGDNSIIFDWKKVPKLQFLDSQEEGRVEFWINLKDDWQMDNLEDKNLTIKNKIYLSQQAREEFITKVNSKLVVEQKGYFQDEVFGNSGPIPPEVGKTTTYTIIWQIQNYYNDIKNVRVKAILPSRVNLTGKIFPEEQNEKFAFDSSSREIVWSIEALPPTTFATKSGGGSTIAFQIAFMPSIHQTGQTPEIIGEVSIFAEDTWTEELLESSDENIDTTLPDDETVIEQQGIIQ
ncbi:hypothetical protein KAU51_01020 [Candidatus Parcubacteria bacterium]|nr:hypothetical protein [Candidatus Parcubacteria bacterium]